mmetsp:Transcript_81420/g.143759  ORF Transcript_81420/g.143759 Transcript_81420/m.143759 type:complete len:214 (+) Transcript_81420:77-718(+)|eukprot:CAMPEP_0197664000 /NCGR_PEP_ID=MMETSP1338-20131121/58369_1 /TAXON_ID=43686 ORGANISM="Pelagodinium beii, Strain RCC1491" /NCGR_SAMPLE_ID=MMETSP1338 /ASSEMBLY_ACC=CAM_ASM_000754 /LENGTH=213 /DNA_ID=CAMNT_0043242547 /DNA_START=76 /DNA_END=717 /DNA_ORIENTATION=-
MALILLSAYFALMASTAAANPLVELLNTVANEHVLKDLRENLPEKIVALGLDPLQSVKASKDLKAENVEGLKNVELDSMDVISVSLSDTDTVAELNVKGHMTAPVTGRIYMGSTGYDAEAKGVRTKEAVLTARLDLQNLVVKSIAVKSLEFEYEELNLKVVGEDTVLPLSAADNVMLESLMSSKVKDVGQETIDSLLPITLPEPEVERAVFFP